MRLPDGITLVPPHLAARTARALINDGRCNGGLSVDAQELVDDLRQVAAAYHRLVLNDAASSSASGTSEPDVTPSDDTMTSMQVAQLAKVSDRYVRAQAVREALIGRRIGRQWLFDKDDVAAWVADRKAS